VFPLSAVLRLRVIENQPERAILYTLHYGGGIPGRSVRICSGATHSRITAANRESIGGQMMEGAAVSV
jgi:hypothetical protein